MSSLAEQRQAVAPFARQELARRHLSDFLELVLPSYQRTAHTLALCRALEALEARELNRAIICMPPRHGKTLHVSQAFPAWVLGRHPEAQVILASYAAELAEQNSRRARGFLLDPRWPFPGVSVSAESAAVGRWGTTTNGMVIAAGVAGGLTGFGADVAVVDDAVRDRADADSATLRASTWSWFTEVLLTRLQPKAAVLVMGTRWHEDDLIGRILSSSSASEWEVLSLPAIAEEDDPLGREEGAPLWPESFDREYLNRLRAQLGERAFASLYQQRPSPEHGGIFQRPWLDGRYSELPRAGVRIVQALDASFKAGTSNDYSAIVTLGADGRFFYVLDSWRARCEYPQLIAAAKREAARWQPEALLIEDAASGMSAIQTLRSETQLPVIPVKTVGASKVSRAEAVSPLFESGRVLFPEQAATWVGVLIEELASFPSGRHDDQVDALVYALARLRTHGGSGNAEIYGEPIDGRLGPLGDGDPSRWTGP